MREEPVYDFGLRLQQLRKDRKMTRKALAQRLDVSKETIYRYENNLQDPSFKRMKQIAAVLNASLDYLAGFAQDDVIKVGALTAEQRKALNEFLRVFVNCK